MTKLNSQRVLLVLNLLALLFWLTCSNDNLSNPRGEGASIVGVVKPDTVAALVRALQVEEKGRDETNSEGFFEIKNLNVGTYSLEVTAPGFRRHLIESITVFDGGTTTVGEIRLTTVPTQILSTSPQDGQVDFSMHAPLQIIFAEPMNRQSVEGALAISPALDGASSWRLSSRHIYSFQPSPRFRPDTEYSVSIGTGALTENGDSLELAYEFHFTTQPVQVSSFFPPNSALFIRPQATLGLTFNTFMNLESVQATLTVEPEIFGSFRWSDFTRLTVIPANSFFADTQYRVTLGNQALDFEGVPLKEPVEFTFTTEPLRVTDHSPTNRQTLVDTLASIFVTFNADMNQNSVQDAFSLSPAASGNFEWFNESGFRFRASSGLFRDTEYTVSLDTTGTDLGGTGLRTPFSFSFTTRP